MVFEPRTSRSSNLIQYSSLSKISACVPFLRWTPGNPKIVFYCHFPDQLLTQRKSALKSLYRKPIDWFEEKTTGMADTVLVNSKFTGSWPACVYRFMW